MTFSKGAQTTGVCALFVLFRNKEVLISSGQLGMLCLADSPIRFPTRNSFRGIPALFTVILVECTDNSRRGTTMGEQERPAIELTECEREPIHIPGSIQPHGVMVVCNENLVVTHVSDNCAKFFGQSPNAILRGQLSALLRQVNPKEIVSRLDNSAETRSLELPYEFCSDEKVTSFDLHVFKDHSRYILEFEPKEEAEVDLAVFRRRSRASLAAVLQADSLSSLYTVLAREVKSLTGYGRVMLYQFDADWHGSVIAEARDARMASYFDQHFPASDIPAQARALYKLNLSRLIRYVEDEQSLLVAAEPNAETVDLTYSNLRSVSPIHLQYLRNMQVQSSLSFSLVESDELWGLIACHHDAPRFVPYYVRRFCESLAMIASRRLTELIEMERWQQQLLFCKKERQLLERVAHRGNDFSELSTGDPNLLSFFPASGAVLQLAGKHYCAGRAISETQIQELIAWLEEQDLSVFHCHDLVDRYPRASEFRDVASGLLAVKIRPASHDWLLWFRSEVAKIVRWSGDPSNPAMLNEDGHFGPRKSFEIWKEQVSGTAAPWEDWEVEGAMQLCESIHNFLNVQELSAARDAAVEASHLKSQFVANISHEIRTPMSGLIGALELLSDNKNLDPERLRILEMAHSCANTLRVLVNDVLDISKIEARHLELESVTFDPLSLVEESIKSLAELAHKKELSLTYRSDATLPRSVVGDPFRVRQVLVNLINNSIKFTNIGEIIVEATVESQINDAIVLRFAVRDSGIGIAKQDQKLLFQPFSQVDSSDTRSYGGAGLGLSICKSLVELMGGTIGVESEKGIGSLFWFVVPFNPAPVRQGSNVPVTGAACEVAEAVPDWRNKFILIVEDDPALQTLVLKQLKVLGIDGQVASTGREALDAIANKHFDLVLMDCNLPGINGFEATRQIRDREFGLAEHIPIVAMTAGVMSGDREKCISAGMDDFLSKPFTMKQLKQKLEHVFFGNGRGS